MLVKNLLESKPRQMISVKPDLPVHNAMDLMIRNNIGCLPVIDDTGELVGIVSDKDIFRKVHETKGSYDHLTVNDLMTTKLIVGLPDDDIMYIAGVMKKNWIRHVPIVDEGAVVGLVSLRDILTAVTRTTDIENRYLKMYMDGLHNRDRSADY